MLFCNCRRRGEQGAKKINTLGYSCAFVEPSNHLPADLTTYQFPVFCDTGGFRDSSKVVIHFDCPRKWRCYRQARLAITFVTLPERGLLLEGGVVLGARIPPLPGHPYVLQHRIGAGGMGEVHKAVHLATGALVAVKTTPKEDKYFLWEAQV